MKITIIDKQPDEENEIIIKCNGVDDNIMNLVRFINSAETQNSNSHYKMKLAKDSSIYFIDTSEILYCESVDDRVFVYTIDNVYETKLKLYMLEQELPAKSFLRANKAQIVNLDMVVSVAPAFGSRFEAILKNDYKVIFSRAYVEDLKIKLGLKEE